ncbi:hypothetical protein HKD37_07G019094 [Glycine soja]
MVVYLGLHIAHDNGILTLVCESDSKVAVSLVKEGVPNTHPNTTIITKICSVIDGAATIKLSHTFREGNKCKD